MECKLDDAKVDHRLFGRLGSGEFNACKYVHVNASVS